MDDDDPFADLGQTLEDEPNKSGSDEAPRSGNSPSNDGSAEESVENREPRTHPAFAYEATFQRPFYAREDTIDDFDPWLKYQLEHDLNQRGYQDIAVREMTDALLRTIVEENLIDEVTERFEQPRESVE